jgi:hypothetical protein
LPFTIPLLLSNFILSYLYYFFSPQVMCFYFSNNLHHVPSPVEASLFPSYPEEGHQEEAYPSHPHHGQVQLLIPSVHHQLEHPVVVEVHPQPQQHYSSVAEQHLSQHHVPYPAHQHSPYPTMPMVVEVLPPLH